MPFKFKLTGTKKAVSKGGTTKDWRIEIRKMEAGRIAEETTL